MLRGAAPPPQKKIKIKIKEKDCFFICGDYKSQVRFHYRFFFNAVKESSSKFIFFSSSFFFFFSFVCVACGILTTGLPGKSQTHLSLHGEIINAFRPKGSRKEKSILVA